MKHHCNFLSKGMNNLIRATASGNKRKMHTKETLKYLNIFINLGLQRSKSSMFVIVYLILKSTGLAVCWACEKTRLLQCWKKTTVISLSLIGLQHSQLQWKITEPAVWPQDSPIYHKDWTIRYVLNQSNEVYVKDIESIQMYQKTSWMFTCLHFSSFFPSYIHPILFLHPTYSLYKP